MATLTVRPSNVRQVKKPRITTAGFGDGYVLDASMLVVGEIIKQKREGGLLDPSGG